MTMNVFKYIFAVSACGQSCVSAWIQCYISIQSRAQTQQHIQLRVLPDTFICNKTEEKQNTIHLKTLNEKTINTYECFLNESH